MTVEEIASTLSPAQCKAMLWMNADGTPTDHVKGSPAIVSFWCLANVLKGDPSKQVALTYRLCKRGENKAIKRGLYPVSTWALTPLGQQVRGQLTKDKT